MAPAIVHEILNSLSVVLYEPGLLSKLFEKEERMAKLKRERFSVVACLVFTTLVLMNFIGDLISITVVNICAVIGTLRSLDIDPNSQTKWLSYWACYSGFSLTAEPLLRMITLKRAHLFKYLFLVVCALPIEKCGATLIYNKILKKKLFKGGPTVPSNIVSRVTRSMENSPQVPRAQSTHGKTK